MLKQPDLTLPFVSDDTKNLNDAISKLNIALEQFDSHAWIAEINNFRQKLVEAYRKQEKERLEAKAKERFLATLNENHSQVNADAIADQLAKLINPSPKPQRKHFWEL
jgi:23S rRNA pseudoU1915 N3-methylase RlmH